MAILHGSWCMTSKGCFFLWGETWRRVPSESFSSEQIFPYPFALNDTELLTQPLLKNMGLSNILSQQIIALPTDISESGDLTPIYSATTNIPKSYLYPWQITGISLNPKQAFQFLQSLPLNTVITSDSDLGEDLRFWSHIARWSLDLLARSKFLPGLIQQSDQTIISQWQPLLDSAIDQARLLRFAQQMPRVCRVYQELIAGDSLAINLPLSAQDIIINFLSVMIDQQVRNVAKEVNKKAILSLPIWQKWLQSLGEQENTINAELIEIESLETTLKNWTAPLQYSLSEPNLFSTAFHLHPPTEYNPNWQLEYCLQAIDQPEFIVNSNIVWNHPVDSFNYRGRTIKHPQETLLKGLGLASKLYPVIETSLQQARPQSCSLNPLQAYQFLKSYAWRFTDSGLGVILPPSLANREGWASRLGLSIKAETPKLKTNERLGLKSLLNFKWQLSIGGQTMTKAEFDRLVAKESPLVEINGEWVELRESDIRSAKIFFSQRKDEMTLSLEDALRLSTGDTQMIEKLPVVNFEAGGKLQELLNTLTNNRNLEPIPNPKDFKGELRPYQARGAGWLSFLEQWGLGACLADDMGLGKTIEFIAFLLHLKEQNSLENPVLLVCPTSVLGNWEREVKKFSPTLNVIVHHGDKRAKGNNFAKVIQDKNLVITSYPLTFRDQKELQGVTWQGLVLDEAQNIKNPDAKQSKTIKNINASFKIALTGTPVENRLSELWSIMDFLNPGYLGQRLFFQRRFAIPIEKYGDTDSLKILRSLVQPFILRRLKTDKDIIQDLPEKQENIVFCPLTTEQATLYQKIVDDSLAKIDDAEGIQRRGMILALLVKLKQLCNHPVLIEAKVKNSKKSDIIKTQYSGKLQRLTEMLDEVLAEGDRALIFTQFAEWGKVLQPYLEDYFNREILFLYGSTSKNKREEMIDRFQNDPQAPPIMILSLKAGGVGLNLTRANHVFHFDRWWNPAVENQATDRVFRIGQTRNVQVHKFVCTGTLEEKIHDLIESKKALAEQVVSAGEDWLTALDTDQLRNLLILDRNSIIDEETPL
ncbi:MULTISPECIES: DEAD/DEAH box helicase [Planktothrix]|uniref:SNF2-related helicase n=1 Tax=Planktothrix rubescens CCAP 1459/22 TaxID=329571 RepID=A0A6J7ZJR7_PLARU|nr:MULTISPECIES: DEAD/DEAH box helicase [Planktothrix]CAC5342351.1 SNF2-related helicase [Planktothrix rubescens NIVA-CYA 18]CAD5923213.1 putative ATP-dependent helicase YwqA [Planktothrix rubescens NIVA-CYA 18]